MKVEAFNMWTCRRLLRVPWREHRTNERALEQLGAKMIMMKQMRNRKLSYIGLTIRHNSLEKLVIQGIAAGKTGWGRPARTWKENSWLDRIHHGDSNKNCWESGVLEHCHERQSSSILSHLTTEERERESIFNLILKFISYKDNSFFFKSSRNHFHIQ